MTHKTVIIPDIHHKFAVAEEIIADEDPDMTVFLGDYFDDFYDTPQAAEATARWLAGSLERGCGDGSRIHMIGNHDLHYMTGGSIEFRCSGYSDAKRDAIDAVGIDWELLRMYYWIGGESKARHRDGKERISGWLCTHAGFTNQLFEQQRHNKSDTVDDVLVEADAELRSVRSSSVGGGGVSSDWDWDRSGGGSHASHPFLQAGQSRGGMGDVGGLLWCDYSEFEDIPRTRQIFGHTRGDSIRHATSANAEHYCIDTAMRSYVVCHDHDAITIKSAGQHHSG